MPSKFRKTDMVLTTGQPVLIRKDGSRETFVVTEKGFANGRVLTFSEYDQIVATYSIR